MAQWSMLANQPQSFEQTYPREIKLGTVRLPRLVGQGRAREIILTGRKVPAEECLRIGACERVVPTGRARQEAEALAQEIARFPPQCVRADRRTVLLQHGSSVRDGLASEWRNSIGILESEGLSGAGQFTGGIGRHGDFTKLKL